jgi:hypothetical protein
MDCGTTEEEVIRKNDFGSIDNSNPYAPVPGLLFSQTSAN